MNILKNIDNIITEARSHSDVNKKESLYTTLYRYLDKDNSNSLYFNKPKYFVHFSNELKIGINPKSRWGHISAYGIYAYPLKYVTEVLTRVGNKTEFGFNKKYATVLEQIDVSGYKFLYIDSDYNNSEDLKKLEDYYNHIMELIPNNATIYKTMLKDTYIKMLKDTYIKKFNSYFEKEDLPVSYANNNNKYNTNNFFYIYYGVDLLVNLQIAFDIKKPRSSGIVANKILMDILGYSGICDLNDYGSMHSDIRYETCFLHPKSYKVIETYNNI